MQSYKKILVSSNQIIECFDLKLNLICWYRNGHK